jgi:hypothetical protein
MLVARPEARRRATRPGVPVAGICHQSLLLPIVCSPVSQVLCKPGTVQPVTKFEASIYALTKEEGGRHTPFFTNYRPQFFFRTADVTGSVLLPATRQMVMPGDNAEVECTLISPMAVQVLPRPIPPHPSAPSRLPKLTSFPRCACVGAHS